jgi:hypothetical protein
MRIISEASEDLKGCVCVSTVANTVRDNRLQG